jgi:uncharacterized protein
MSDISNFEFSPSSLAKIKESKYGKDWPVVYILENGKEAYVGETVNASSRFKQHLENDKRQRLNSAYIISDPEYNKSASLDIESSLIQFMSADGVFILQNGNAGLLNHSYYDREKYQAKFETIWQKLQEINLAHHDLLQLKNKDIFKYSPYKALTAEQAQVVEDIYFNIRTSKDSAHIIHGEPGTGKTILAVYLVKYLLEQETTKHLKIGLVVPMTGLRNTLKKVFRGVKGLSGSMVIGPSEVVGANYDVLIVDEAHRLRRRVNITNYQSFDEANNRLGLGKNGTELDWVLLSSNHQILFYDEKQSVRPSDIKHAQIDKLSALEYKLQSQLRVKGGEDYIRFIDDLLALKTRRWSKPEQYDFRVISSVSELKTLILNKENESGLSRLVAGYAWPWLSKKSGSQDYDIEIEGLKFKWNSTNIDWVNSINAINEVGCIHTVQGYDLNYVGVIIGPEVSYDKAHNRLVIDSQKYMDMNGKRSITDSEELERYIMNIYKTLMTRGIHGTYVYAVDEGLQKYLTNL